MSRDTAWWDYLQAGYMGDIYYREWRRQRDYVRAFRKELAPLEDWERKTWPTNTSRRERLDELIRANRIRRYGPVNVNSIGGMFKDYAKGIMETLHQNAVVSFISKYGYDPLSKFRDGYEKIDWSKK